MLRHTTSLGPLHKNLLTYRVIRLQSILLRCTIYGKQELPLYVTPEQIQAAQKANVEALLAVANAQFAAFEKLANISAGAVKSAFEESVNNTRALLGAKDVQEFVTLQNAFAQPAIEKAMAYSKSIYEVATEANSELSKVAERRVAEWNENFVSLLDKVSKNAPAGSDVAVAAVKSMLAAANSAYDNMSKVAKQATEIAEANVSAATETMKGLAKTKAAA
jgi:phasin family protein